jgi:thiosulfate/3-mercaptopyruvate sulfurtransferase
MNATPQLPDGLVDADILRRHLQDPGWRVLDCRHDLAQPAAGRALYAAGHVPGAAFAHLDEDLSGPRNGRNGRHPLPGPEALAGRLRAWGVEPESMVVAYDASEGCYAARAWWLLRWLGHARVAVLDGGWPAWLAAGGAVQTRTPAPAPGGFERRPALQATVTAAEVLALVQAPQRARLLLDARAPDRYEGRNETLDPVGGHIPGARNRFWKCNLGPDGRFKATAALRAEYEALLAGRTPGEAIAQCGSGVTACHDLLAMHLAGLEGAALYPGSWSEWVADPGRPVATGAEPG